MTTHYSQIQHKTQFKITGPKTIVKKYYREGVIGWDCKREKYNVGGCLAAKLAAGDDKWVIMYFVYFLTQIITINFLIIATASWLRGHYQNKFHKNYMPNASLK